MPDGARFCPSCGHLLVLSEERRVVTVLFADLVGFTALSEGEDPEFVKHLIDRCFRRLVADVTAFGGTVDKIVGDAVVALFGAPKAHEDDAERAVRAALRMQRSLVDVTSEVGVEVKMRVGINTGEVLVGAISAGGDYTAMGDTVNLASRLESMAEPGEVLVGPTTRDATLDAIDYAPRGSFKVRGRDEEIEACVAVGELRPPGRLRKAVNAPLVGRSPELSHLAAAIDASVERGRAHLLLIAGETGLGKTRLAEEIASDCEERHDALVLEGRVLPYGEPNPYRPIGEALAAAFEIDAGDSLQAARQRLTMVLRQLLGVSDNDPGLDQAINAAMFILGYETPIDTFEPSRLREELRVGLSTIFSSVAERRPVLVTLGDIHWADKRLLELLEGLLVALTHSRFIVLTTARWMVDEDRWVVPPGRHNTTVINLGPLSKSSSDELVRSLLGGDVDGALVDALYERSGGNPFFLEELTALLRGAEGATRRDLTHRLKQLPDTLRGLVAARLDALDPDERSMVDDAAVVGRSGPVYALLMLATRAGSEKPEHTFGRLVDKDVFAIEADRWVFRSDVVRDLAYSTLTKTSRALSHLDIAEWLESHRDDTHRAGEVSAIARHFSAAAYLHVEMSGVPGLPDDIVDTAISYLLEAGSRASARDAFLIAGRMYAQGLGLTDDDDPRRAELAVGRARARVGLRELAGAEADALEARRVAELHGDGRTAAASTTLLGEAATLAGNPHEGEFLLDEAIELWRELDDPAEVAEALRLRGMAHMALGDRAQAENDFSEALHVFMALGDSTGEAWCQQNLAWLSFESGRIDEANQRIDRAIELFTQNDDAGGLGWALGLWAFLMFHGGESSEAEATATMVLEEAIKRGDRFGESMMRLLLATIALWRGECRKAVDSAREAVAVLRDSDSVFGEVQGLATLTRAHAALGNLDESRRSIDEALKLAESEPGAPQVDFCHMVAGAALAQLGLAERSKEELDLVDDDPEGPIILGSIDRMVTRAVVELQLGRAGEASAILRVLDDAGPRGPYHECIHALAAVCNGDTREAIESADAVRASTRATYLDHRSANLARALAFARDGATDRVVEAFDEAVVIIDATESRLSQAVVRLGRAIAYETLGHADASEARAEADSHMDALGVALTGWENLFHLALATNGPDPTAAGRSMPAMNRST
ncbi:MAG: AAA family ATPase [Actinomycetia bacterium]|nr:AAA family ATPase [Actinomycetes bacterium]